MATRAPGRPLHVPDPATPDRSVGAASVIPGFGLTMGLTIAWLSLIVLIPLSSIFLRAAGMGWADFVAAGFSPRAIAAYKVSFGTALIAALVNALFGLLTAWVLVRYDFPGRRIRSEEHTSELQSLMRISYAVFCLKKKNKDNS